MTRRWTATRRLWPAATLLAVVVMAPLVPSPAQACSGSACRSPRVFPAGGNLPRDQLTLTYWPGSDSADAGVVLPRLYRLDGDLRSEVPLALSPLTTPFSARELAPMGALAPGTKLLLESGAPSCDPTATLAANFTVTESAPAPLALGTLRVTLGRAQPLQVATLRGSCDEELDAAYADLTLELVSEAQLFSDVLDYEWVVDGAVYLGFSSSLRAAPSELPRRGTQRVYAPCEPHEHLVNSLALGSHRALVRGKLRGVGTVATPEVSFELRCDAGVPPSVVEPGAPPDPSALPESRTTTDAGERAQAAGTRDASNPQGPHTVRDAATASSTAKATEVHDGCALATRPGTRPAWGAFLGVAFALLVARRRRT